MTIYTINGFHAPYDLIFFSCDHDFKILKQKEKTFRATIPQL